MGFADALYLFFLKARRPPGPDLFAQVVHVEGFTNAEGHYVAPHTAIRHKRREVAKPVKPVAAAEAAPDLFSVADKTPQGDLFAQPAKPAQTSVIPPKPAEEEEAVDKGRTLNTPPLPESEPADIVEPATREGGPPAPTLSWGVPAGTSKAARRAWNDQAVALLQAKGDGPYTDADKAVLARYSGSGGSGDSLNEFYTDEGVARAMWSMLRTLGFAGGDVLEPSSGIGVFLHTAPDDSRVQAVELSPISGQICSILNERHGQTEIASLERFATQDGRKFDAVVGNPPYGPRGSLLADDKKDLALAETYFVDTALDKAKDGGLVALVLPTRIMDSSSLRSFRQRMLSKAEFITAFRLPNTAFEASHTEVTTDVLILRKRPQDVAGALGALDQEQLKTLGVWDAELLSGTYFTEGRGRANILGTMEPGWRAKAFGQNDITVTGDMTGVADALASWVPSEAQRMVSGLTVQQVLAVVGEDPTAQRRIINAAAKVPYQEAKAGETRTINGVLYVLRGDPLRWHRVEDGLAEAVQDAREIGMLLDDLVTGRSKDAAYTRAQLVEALDEYVANHGIPSANKDLKAWLEKPHLPLDGDGADHGEVVEETMRRVARLLGAVSPSGSYSDLVTGVERRLGERDIATVAERLSLENGHFTPAELSEAWGQGDIETVLDALYAGTDYALAEDGQSWSTMDVYLSGELWPKLDTARGLILHEGITPQAKAKYEMQAKRLEEAIAPKPLDDVEVRLNSGFITPEIVQAFINKARLDYISEGRGAHPPAEIAVSFDQGVWSFRNVPGATGYRGNDVDLIDKFLNRTGVRKDDYDRLQTLNDEFKDWLLTSDFREETEDRYNRAYLGFRTAHQSDTPIPLPGLATDRGVNAYHWSAIRWAVEAGKGILAGDVGLGKTTQALLLARMAKSLGRAKKPTIVVPKSVMSNWLAEIEAWFPGSKVMAIGETQVADAKGNIKSKSDDAETRRRKYHEMQQNDYDFVLISRPAWDDLDVDPVTKGKYIEDDFWVQRGKALGQAGDKRVNRIREAYNQAVAGRAFDKERQNTVYFNDLGIDMLILDEAHAYKNLYSVKARFGGKPKFLGGDGESNTALDTFFKSRSLREANGGKGIYMLTATPTKNSPLEVFSMLSHIAPEAFEHLGIRNSEDFLDRFCKFEMEPVLGVSGGWEEQLVTKGFKNMGELREVMKRFIDRKTAEDVGLQIPAADVRQHIVDMTAEQEAEYAALRLAAAKPKDKDDTGDDHIFSIMDRMGKASLDLALLKDGTDSGTPKIDACVAEASENAKEGGQIIFCEALPTHAKIRAKLIAAGLKPEEIGIISGEATKSSAERQTIADKFNAGIIKVVIANKAAEEGVNLQKRTTDIHHLDLPWNAAGLQQRNGRGRRQGNKAASIRIHTYFAKGSFDAYRYQTVTSKRDWQDSLWHGGDEVENLAMEGKFSPQEMMVMLSPDPTAAAEALASNKEEVRKMADVAGRQKAAGMFEEMNRMRTTLAALRKRADKGGETAARLEGAIKARRDGLSSNPRFERKDLLDKTGPVLYEPYSGFAWEPSSGLELTPGPDAPATWGTEPSKWVVSAVVPGANGFVRLRPYGRLQQEDKGLSLSLKDLQSGVKPFEFDKDVEAKALSDEMQRLTEATDKESAAQLARAANIATIKRFPSETIERMAPQLTKQLKASMLAYSDGTHAAYGMLDAEGKPVAFRSYDGRSKVETHDPMLPMEAHKAKAIEGYIAMGLARKIDTQYQQSSGRKGRSYSDPKSTGTKASYPGFEYDQSTYGNPWGAIIRDLWDKDVEADAKQELHRRVLANIADAPTMRAAVVAASPMLEPGFNGVTWPHAIKQQVARRIKQLHKPGELVGATFQDVTRYKGDLHPAALKFGRYGHDYSYVVPGQGRTVGDFVEGLTGLKHHEGEAWANEPESESIAA